MSVPGVGGPCSPEHRARENGLREDRGGVVEEFGMGEGGIDCQAPGQASLKLEREGVVARLAHVVSEEGDVREAGVWPEQLVPGERGSPERRRGWNLP